MKSMLVQLPLTEKAKEFVRLAQSYPYEILLKSGKFVVNAKSLLGVLSLDHSKPITVEVYGDDCDELMQQLHAYAVPSL